MHAPVKFKPKKHRNLKRGISEEKSDLRQSSEQFQLPPRIVKFLMKMRHRFACILLVERFALRKKTFLSMCLVLQSGRVFIISVIALTFYTILLSLPLTLASDRFEFRLASLDSWPANKFASARDVVAAPDYEYCIGEPFCSCFVQTA